MSIGVNVSSLRLLDDLISNNSLWHEKTICSNEEFSLRVPHWRRDDLGFWVRVDDSMDESAADGDDESSSLFSTRNNNRITLVSKGDKRRDNDGGDDGNKTEREMEEEDEDGPVAAIIDADE